MKKSFKLRMVAILFMILCGCLIWVAVQPIFMRKNPLVVAQAEENTNVASVTIDGVTTEYTTFAEALKATNGKTATVELLKNCEFSAKITLSGNATNVTVNGNGYTLTRAYAGTLFELKTGATLTLGDDLTIDGANEWVLDKEKYNEALFDNASISKDTMLTWFTPEEGAPVATAYLITVAASKLYLNDITVQNNYSASNAGVVTVSANSTVHLTGTKILHCTALTGSGLAVNMSGANIDVTMNEGTVIDGNHVGSNHGIFKVYSGAVFTMNGGEIKNTTGWNSNGVTIGIYNATMYMHGGSITSNSGVRGPNNGRNAAIYGHNNSKFVMTGGTISQNTGGYGGVDNNGGGGSVNITGGKIVDNVSRTNHANKDINIPATGSATITVTGGEFTQDISDWVAEDAALEKTTDESGKITYQAKTAEEDEVLVVWNTIETTTEEVDGVPTTVSKTVTVSKDIVEENTTLGAVASAKTADLQREGYYYSLYTLDTNGDELPIDTNQVIEKSEGSSKFSVYVKWQDTSLLQVKASSVVYSGEPKTTSLTVKDELGNAASVQASVIGYENNVNAGTAQVFYKIGNDPKEYTAEFTIEKAIYDMSGVSWEYSQKLIYNGGEQTVVLSGLPQGVTADYSGNKGTKTGSYQANAVLHYDENNYHAPSEMETLNWVIEKAPLTVQAVSLSVTYGEELPAYQWIYSGFLGTDGVHSIASEPSVSSGYISGMPVSQSGLLIEVSGGMAENYYFVYKTGTITIEKATYDMSGVQFLDKSAVYNGEPFSIEIEGNLPATVVVSYENQKHVNAGVYEVIAKFTGDENYHEIQSLKAVLTIEKAASQITLAPTAKELTYTGKAQMLVNAGDGVGGVVVYSLTKDGEYSERLPKAIYVGNHTVWYYVQGDENHENSEVASVTVNIQVIEKPQDKKVTYTVLACGAATIILAWFGLRRKRVTEFGDEYYQDEEDDE